MKTAILKIGLALCMTAAATLADDRPNILIIMTDDSGYSDIGSFGGEIDTPNIDTLAEKGVRLSSFYSNGRCSPTRASLLSGLDCAKVGFGGGVVGDWVREMPYPAHRARMPYEIPLLPELLKEAGYQTMMVGKWHLGGSTMKFSEEAQEEWETVHEGWELTEEEIEADFNGLPSQRGFDEYFGLYGAQDDLFVTKDDDTPIMDGNQPAKLNFDRTYTMNCYTNHYQGRYSQNNGKTAKAYYDTDGITDRALKMIDASSGEDKPPFLLYVSYRAPHVPLQAPDELVQKYLPAYRDFVQVESNRVAKLTAEGLFPKDAEFRSKWIPEDEEEKYVLMMALHAAMMEKVDENVGRMIESLEKKGELENTLVIFMSDNGCASHLQGFMNAPYHGCKALLWEGGPRTHFIATWPGKIEPGTLSHDQAWVGDILPTCLDVAGAEYPKEFRGKKTEDLDGRSMMPILEGEKRKAAKTLFFNDKGQQTVIYKGRWKLLIEPGWYLETIASPEIAYELYDLENDPAETNNLADKKKRLVKKLVKKTEKWKKECDLIDYAELVKLRPNDPY